MRGMSIVEWLRDQLSALSAADRALAARIEEAEGHLGADDPARALETLGSEEAEDRDVLARYLHVKIRAALALRDLLALESMSLHAEVLGSLLPEDARELMLQSEAIGALNLAKALAEGISASGSGAGEDILRIQQKKERRLLDDGSLRLAVDALGEAWTDIRLIGWGRSSTVYSALPAGGGARVAFKFLGPRSAEDGHAWARFEREFEALSRLDHPAILRVHDFSAEDPPYLRTEFFPGADLRRLLEQGRVFFASEIARIGIALCEAVQHAHDGGVIHRNVQPANILMDHDGNLKLVDFGLARLESIGAISSDGMVLGEWFYMSPEQFAGSPDGPTHAMDVFGIGATLYHLAVKKPPFARGRGLNRARNPPVNAAAPRLRDALKRVITRCLADDPAERYPRPADMVGHLKEAL